MTAKKSTVRREKKIVRVSYGRTISLGNYESTRVDLVADVAPDEDWEDVLDQLRSEILKQEKLVKKQGF